MHLHWKYFFEENVFEMDHLMGIQGMNAGLQYLDVHLYYYMVLSAAIS